MSGDKRPVGRPRKDDRPEHREGEGRKKRIPMGGMVLKMAAPDRAGFHRHWAADRKQNLTRYLNAGYQFVTDEKSIDEAGDGQSTRVGMVTGTLPNGDPEYSYLMEIPLEYYEADQKAKQAEIDEIDETLRRGHLTGADPRDVNSGAFYAGSKTRGDIVMETSDGSR